MNMQKMGIAVIVGTIVQFALGFIFYGLLYEMIMGSSPMPEGGPESPNMLYIVLSNVAFCTLLAYIYMRWAGIKTFNSGAMAGLTLGLIIVIMNLFSSMSMEAETDWSRAIYGLIAALITSYVVGGVIGYMLGRE